MYGTKETAPCFDVACEDAMTLDFLTRVFSACLYHSTKSGVSVFRHEVAATSVSRTTKPVRLVFTHFLVQVEGTEFNTQFKKSGVCRPRQGGVQKRGRRSPGVGTCEQTRARTRSAVHHMSPILVSLFCLSDPHIAYLSRIMSALTGHFHVSQDNSMLTQRQTSRACTRRQIASDEDIILIFSLSNRDDSVDARKRAGGTGSHQPAANARGARSTCFISDRTGLRDSTPSSS